MTDYILISVIIPVYNGERFISRAVESVLGQTAENFEIILVNDGSVDNSGRLCDAYARKYDNVHVVHKDNGGISSARNAGIAAARGEYFVFLDADDYLDPDTCEEIGRVIREHHPDCIDFGWKYVGKSGEITENYHKIQKNTLLGADILRDQILPSLLNLRHDPDHFIFDFSCTKVFRAELIQRNHIAYDENRRIWEDRPFVVHYLRFCWNYYAMDRCFYNYVDMPGSLSRRYSMDFFRIIIENFWLYQKLFGDTYDFDTPYVNSYWCRSVESLIYRSLEQDENRRQIRQNILETLQNDVVVNWFAKRTPQNNFEKKVSELIAQKRAGEAFAEFQKKHKSRKIQTAIREATQKARRLAKKVLGVKQ